MTQALAVPEEVYIERQDSFGHVRRVLFQQWKEMVAPLKDGRPVPLTDAQALAFYIQCETLGAVPEIGDMQLALMKGRLTPVVREQLRLRFLKRKYPQAVERYGLIGPDGKPKAWNAVIHKDDLLWHEFLNAPGGQVVGRVEMVRREWQRTSEGGQGAWDQMPNHMFLVRARCHNAMRVAPLEPIRGTFADRVVGQLPEPEALGELAEEFEVGDAEALSPAIADQADEEAAPAGAEEQPAAKAEPQEPPADASSAPDATPASPWADEETPAPPTGQTPQTVEQQAAGAAGALTPEEVKDNIGREFDEQFGQLTVIKGTKGLTAKALEINRKKIAFVTEVLGQPITMKVLSEADVDVQRKVLVALWLRKPAE